MLKATVLALALALACAAGAQAQSNCSDGTVYDDGQWEQGSGFNSANVGRGSYVQRLDPVFAPAQLRSVCICWARSGSDSSISFDLNVWAADGPSGLPGTLLGKLPLSAVDIPQTVGTGTIIGHWTRYDITALGVVTSAPVYVGPAWNPKSEDGFFLCEDQSFATPDRPVYVAANPTPGTQDTPPSINPRIVNFLMSALGIRGKFNEPSGTCIPSSTQLCLKGGRFAVTAKFKAGTNPEGTANVTKLTDETGYLWFFSAANVEAVVKVLDACALNGKFWVFAGGLTDVRVELTVTDTQTGNFKTYTNPQGSPFQPIQDTQALSCN
jgi:hypothetical protein